MDVRAVRTVRIHNWKWPRTKAEKLLIKYKDLITKKYPQGIEETNQYFTVPGYEHVTKDQPIIFYNHTEGSWEISVANQFINPKQY